MMTLEEIIQAVTLFAFTPTQAKVVRQMIQPRVHQPRARMGRPPQTHCKREHELHEQNVYWTFHERNGRTYKTRECKTCKRMRDEGEL